MAATSDHVIETGSLCHRFGGRTALGGLTLDVPRGGVHALVGRNGAGKTTLLRLLLGFLTPSAGWSRVLGVDSLRLTPEIRGRIGYVNEEHALPGWMTVAGLLDVHRPLHPRWNEKVYREVAGPFRLSLDQRVSQLSRGERAGLNLALALAQGPDLLLLDEPTLGLDAVAKQAIVESILFAGGETTTVLYSSHHLDEIERVADDLIVLDGGRLAAFATPEELVARVRGFLVGFLPPSLALTTLPGILRSRDLEGQTEIVVLDPEAGFRERLQALGARGVTSVPLAFDRAVNALLSREPGRSQP